MKTKLSLCNDEIAVYREDEGAFRCYVNWDGIPVLVRIACDPYNTEGLKRAKEVFEKLWENQEYYEEVWDNEYFFRLLPILTQRNKYIEEVLTEDDLEHTFQLSEITIIEDMPTSEVQASYVRQPEKIEQIEICVAGTLEKGFHTLYVEGIKVKSDDEK